MTTFKKYFLSISLASLGFLTVFVISTLILMNSLYYDIKITELENTAKTIASIIGEETIAGVFLNNETAASQIYLPINPDNAYRLTLIATTGYVLWDSHVADRMVNHIDRLEVRSALDGKAASDRRNSITTKMKYIYFALPVFDSENNVIGAFRLSYAVPGFSSRVSCVLFPFLIFTLIGVFVISWMAFVFSRSLSNSLVRLAGITQSGTDLLSAPEAKEKIVPEFRSLEKSLQTFVGDLNSRLEKTKSEGRRLEAILNGMSEAVLAMDSGLMLHMVNPRAGKLFNLSNLDISSMSLLEVTRSTELVEIANKALDTNTALEKELSLRIGSEQYYQVLASPLAGRGGVVLVLQDITKLKKLERVRKDFVANVSHELRTPIQLIKGFSETLLDTGLNEDKGDKKKIAQFSEIINKNAGVMENLTNDLLILADLENNNSGDTAHYRMEELNVASLVNEAISSLEQQANKKNIKIVVDCPNDLTAKLFGSFITQALINLIDNGIKYSQAKSKLWVNARKESSELVLEVHDKGIGISSEHMGRIFERFYRVDRARSRESGGSSPSTGLGLSIVRHIALLHKGTVEAESHAGEGSVFRLRLPQS